MSHTRTNYPTCLGAALLAVSLSASLTACDGSGGSSVSPISKAAASTLPAPSAPSAVAKSVNTAWNGQTTFNLVNGTRGQYPDSQVYWAIIGRDPQTGAFVHVTANGTLQPMALSDNGALVKNGANYSNYFQTIAQQRSITIPQITSARLYMSVGSPMYIQVNQAADGSIAYAGANLENPTDPNINVTFDFVEMSIGSDGFYGNTTRVDQFGFPVVLRLQGGDGYDQTVGETETRAALIAEYKAQVPAAFEGLAEAPYAPYRIIAPAHASFGASGSNSGYLDAYISSVWNTYTSSTLTFTDAQGTFTGQVQNGRFVFSDGQGTYAINSKPTTAQVLLGNGPLNDATGAAAGVPVAKQLQIQAQMCAALNRAVATSPQNWSAPASFYPAGQAANSYAQFWHAHSLNGLAYGFAYDDVGGFSSSLHDTAPTTVTVTVGW